MKKALILLLIIFVLTFFLYSSSTAFALNEKEIEISIEGIKYLIKVPIESDIVLKKRTTYYDFVKNILQDGLSPEKILDYISSSLGKGFFRELTKYEIQPINATQSVSKNGVFKYVEGKNGKLFDRYDAALQIAKALDGEKATLALKEVEPEITTKTLMARTRLLASFETPLKESSSARNHNIKLACSFINSMVIGPFQDFSFNNTVGARSQERGFKSAKIIIDGEYVDGIGGGVCQLATTVYNAVLLSGLKVKKVARHSYPPKYIAPSRDAMVSSSSDFIFENNTEYPIYLFADVANNRVRVRIYGLKQGDYKLKSVEVKRTPYQNVDIDGKLLTNTDGYTLISKGIEGINSELYLINTNGEAIRIRSDTYKTKNAKYSQVDHP